MIYTNTLSSTGSTTAEDVGLGNVDDTSDANKPVSTAQQTALNAKVAIADIANSLSVDIANVPLSAKMGKVLKDHVDTINALLQSDAASLDTLQEVVDYVKLNRSDLENLSVSGIAGLQTALNAKVDTGDSRLSDSREWSGDTVSQVEAEAGTSTARRAWTAQRIRQAINKVVSTLSDAATTSVAAIRAGTTKADVGLSSVDNYSRESYDGRYLARGAKAADSAALDSLSSTQFLRSDTGTIPESRLPASALAGDTNTTYSAGTGISLSGTVFNVDSPFDASGNYASLRAQATTKADVGLSNIPNLGVSSTAMADSIMQRDSSGDTWARLFRSSYSSTNSDIAGIYTTKTIGSDYMRPSTPAQLKAALSITKGDVGLANVNNTSDMDKPVSHAQSAAISDSADAAGASVSIAYLLAFAGG